ncbi:VWD domain-containing protein [Arthrobacter ramosus]|uniref:VWD domain-containing protein n=1 Tax=Arthrobacter ramosus TaxID=1672 RepID=UPI001F463765|nr:VWD domain-containing protein [Arthrobacter ramosus]
MFNLSQQDTSYAAQLSSITRPYTDAFKIHLGNCPDGSEQYVEYAVSKPADGALMVTPGKAREDCNQPARVLDVQWLDQDFDTWPRTYPMVLPLIGTIGGGSQPEPLWLRTLPLRRFADLVESVLHVASCTWLCIGSDGVRTPDGPLDLPTQLMLMDWLKAQGVQTAFGDPHLVNLDGTAFDVQSVGEFDLVQSAQDDVPYDFRVQARFKGLSGGKVSTTDAVAFVLNGKKVILSSTGLTVEGTHLDIPDGSYVYFGAGSAVFRSGNAYAAVWPGQTDRPVLTFESSNVRIHVPPAISTRGLLGNNNGIKGDDFVTRGGWNLGANPSAAALHGSFADSWRITDATSLFSYDAGQSTATFTDTSYPQNIVKVSDYSADVITAAQNSCHQANVEEGPALSGCISDVILSGDAPTYTALAAQVKAPASSLVGSKTFDSNGHLGEDFESAVAPNLDPYRLSTDPATSTIAGPLSGDRPYAFSVTDMPAHNSLTVAFDLLTLGTWDGVNSSLALNIDGTSVWSSSLSSVTNATPAGTGQLASGDQFKKYRVSVNLPHLTPTLKASLTASGIALTASRAIGIDNIDITEQLIPPQTFALPLDGSAISDGVPGAGAGNLETRASKDAYTFTVPDGGKTLFLDFRSCVSNNGNQYLNGLMWQVVNAASGAKVAGDYCGSGNTSVALPAGDYRLELTTDPTRDSWGTYSLAAFFVPDPQTFTLPLDGSAISNGVPGTGAGNLETKGSKDFYTFTVPAGGKTLYLDFNRDCVNHPANIFLNGLTWQVTSVANGAKIAGDYCGSGNKTVALAAGDYRLETGTDIIRNSYGTYSLSAFFVPDPQTFTLPLDGSTVSNGVPGPGAGNLETKASKDFYTFTVPAGGKTLYLDFNRDCVNHADNIFLNGLTWQVTSIASGAKVAGDYCGSGNKTVALAAGDYRLEMGTDLSRNSYGTYSLSAFFVPDPQTFALPLDGSAVSNGVPGSGAGNLETKNSTDLFTFNVPDGGRTLFLDFRSCLSNPANTYLNGLTWQVVSSFTGVRMGGDYCGSGNKTVGLPPGDYRLEMGSDIARNSYGTYSLAAFFVPDPQTFVLPLDGNAVSNGVPGAGAGNLETKGSQDLYTFTVPTGGRTLFLDFRSCLSNPANTYLNGLTWQVTSVASGAKVAGDYCGSGNKTVALAAGDYRLEMGTDITRNSYGTYSLSAFFVPDPQTFTLPLDGSAISDGVPGTGAGNLETKGSKDAYTFTVPDGGKTLFLDFRSCISNNANQYLNGLTWQVTSVASGAKVAGDYCGSGNKTVGLPPGDYRLEMGTDITRNSYGTYSLAAFFVPDPQTFTLPLDGSTVSNGVPGAGAGNLETKGSKDLYTFTVPTGGRTLFLDFRSCLSNPANTYLNGITWQVTSVASGAKVAGDYCGSGNKTVALAAGDYRLEMGTDISRNSYGTYSLAAFFVPDPQTFVLPLDGSLVSDGVPGTGAGNLETKASKDAYTFTVPDGGKTLFLDFRSCISNNENGYLNGLTWQVTSVASGAKVAGDYCGSGNKTVALAAGDYKLEMGTDVSRNSYGTYSLAAFFVPDPQTFTLPLDGSVVSDGVPASGAGNLETKASKDFYTFTVPAGGKTLYLDLNRDCVNHPANIFANGLTWQVTSVASGAKVAGDYCGSGNKTVALAAGDYRLEMGTDISRNSYGTYSLSAFFVPDPQTFTLPLDGSAISDGVPGTGAGNLETKASKDFYTFTVPAGGKTLYLDFNRDCVSHPDSIFANGLTWQVTSIASGAKVAGDYCGSGNKTVALPAGDYRLEMGTDIARKSYGTYSLAAFFVPDPQTFTIPLDGSTVSDGVPAAGAGNLETKGSKDFYTFTVATGGKTLSISWVTCLSNPANPYANGLTWQVTSVASGAKVAGDYCASGNKTVALPAGDYRLEMASDITRNSYGTYSFSGAVNG